MAAFAERRQVIVSELNQVPGFRCTEPGGAFYAFPNIEGTGMSARDLQDNLLNETGVAIIAGTSFGAMGEGYVRFFLMPIDGEYSRSHSPSAGVFGE